MTRVVQTIAQRFALGWVQAWPENPRGVALSVGVCVGALVVLRLVRRALPPAVRDVDYGWFPLWARKLMVVSWCLAAVWALTYLPPK